MGLWNLGSVAETVHALVSVPTSLSGTQLLALSDRKREFVAGRVGVTIGSNSIEIPYQDAIANFTAAEAAYAKMGDNAASSTGGTAKRIKLGDLDIDRGTGTGQNNDFKLLGDYYHKKAQELLNNLGRKVSSYKANG